MTEQEYEEQQRAERSDAQARMSAEGGSCTMKGRTGRGCWGAGYLIRIEFQGEAEEFALCDEHFMRAHIQNGMRSPGTYRVTIRSVAGEAKA